MLPSGPKETERYISSLLQKAQAIALTRIEALLRELPTLELGSLLTTLRDLSDLRLTIEWADKLEQKILNGKVPLVPHGVKGIPSVRKLSALASQLKKGSGGESEPDWMGDLPDSQP